MIRTEYYDVVVVGARCAGSPLAALLARKGLRVAVVEQTTFPRDTLSTHCLHASALTFLDRLGVTEQVRATGAPYLRYFDLRQDDVQERVEIPQRPGDVGGIASIRRLMLDPILARTAAESGANIHMAAKVTAVLEDRGRVVGVSVSRDGSEHVMRAKLVVGADGRNSTVATLVGARKYNLMPNERFAYWAFFEGVNWQWESTFVFHRWADRLILAGQADSGLGQVIVVPQLSELSRFRADLERSFTEYARSCESVNVALESAKRVGKFFGMLRWEAFSGRRAVPAGHSSATRATSRIRHLRVGSRMRSARSRRSRLWSPLESTIRRPALIVRCRTGTGGVTVTPRSTTGWPAIWEPQERYRQCCQRS
jgi:hypothetical protein